MFASCQFDSLDYGVGLSQAINNSGQVVGYEGGGSTVTSDSRAVVWDATNGTLDLNTVYGNRPPTFVLNAATAIDDNGDVVGFGTDRSGTPIRHFS